WFVAFYGCRWHDYALANDLAASGWLRLAPPGTEPSGPPSADCEDDDDIAMGTQEHLRRVVDMASVLEFYRRELPERGWAPAPGLGLAGAPASSDSSACWTSVVDGRQVHLAIHAESEPGRYQVQLSARVDGSGGWCD
ncbi:MAG: hypothetical protein ACRCZP_16720, partial [Phycicoccus sp.]